jgi:hypothetical protein
VVKTKTETLTRARHPANESGDRVHPRLDSMGMLSHQVERTKKATKQKRKKKKGTLEKHYNEEA